MAGTISYLLEYQGGETGFCWGTPCGYSAGWIAFAGAAAGAAPPGVEQINGIDVDATYDERCEGLYTLVSATPTHWNWEIRTHGLRTGWSESVVSAQVERVGTVALVGGEAVGAAVMFPLGLRWCYQHHTELVVAAMAFVDS